MIFSSTSILGSVLGELPHEADFVARGGVRSEPQGGCGAAAGAPEAHGHCGAVTVVRNQPWSLPLRPTGGASRGAGGTDPGACDSFL